MKKFSLYLIGLLLAFGHSYLDAAHDSWRKREEEQNYLVRARGPRWKRFHRVQNSEGELANLLQSRNQQEFLIAANAYATKWGKGEEILFNHAIVVTRQLARYVIPENEQKVVLDELKNMMKGME